MNKKEVLEKIKKELKLDDDMIKKIGDVFEKNFLAGKNNKETIINLSLCIANIGLYCLSGVLHIPS